MERGVEGSGEEPWEVDSLVGDATTSEGGVGVASLTGEVSPCFTGEPFTRVTFVSSQELSLGAGLISTAAGELCWSEGTSEGCSVFAGEATDVESSGTLSCFAGLCSAGLAGLASVFDGEAGCGSAVG